MDEHRLDVDENSAAGMSRGLVERTEAWGQLVARAQRIISEVQNDLRRKQEKFAPEYYYDLEQSAPLEAAARILDAASTAGNLDPSHRQGLAFCAAAAFAMHGNFPSAHAMIEKALVYPTPVSSLVWLAIGCISPRILATARVKAIAAGGPLASSAIESLQSFLFTGDQQQIDTVDKLILKAFALCSDNLENLLLGYARVSLRHVALLSTRRSGLYGVDFVADAIFTAANGKLTPKEAITIADYVQTCMEERLARRASADVPPHEPA